MANWKVEFEFAGEGKTSTHHVNKKAAEVQARYVRNTGAKNVKIVKLAK
jgi:hypothetical protein